MNTKHTPGPWVIATYQSFANILHGNSKIALVYNGGIESDEGQANAALLAAAPELLAQCKGVYFLLCQMDWPSRNTAEGQAILCNLRDAIAKAEGKS